MKLKNNLSEKAYVHSFLEQGYEMAQIYTLLYSIENHLGLESFATPDMTDEHMNMLIEFIETDVDVKSEYILGDGTLDVESLEYDFGVFERYQACAKVY